MKTQRNEKGFTLIELIVVIAIMGIIGAALVPQFATMAKRARMSTDVSTIQTAQQQVEIYRTKYDCYPASEPSAIVTSLASLSMLDKGYLKSLTGNSYALALQTHDAEVSFSNSKLCVVVTADDYKLYDKEDNKGVWIYSK